VGLRVPGRSADRDPVLILLILAGGSVGTAARAFLEASHPAAPGGWPWTTFAINMLGAFTLGLLLESLASTVPDRGWRLRVRLGAGTGLLGGFTTYSTFSVETVSLLRHAPALGVGYGLATALLGLAAAWAGMAIAGRVVQRTARRPEAAG